MPAQSAEQDTMDRLADEIRKSIERGDTSSTQIAQPAQTQAPPPPPPPVSMAAQSLQAPTTPVASVSRLAEAPISSDDDLSGFISKLSPKQLAKVRKLAAKEGITITPGPKKDADGNTMVTVKINLDLVEAIKAWSEQSGLSFDEQVQQLVDYLLPGFLIGGMGTPEIAQPVAPPVVPVPAAATTT